MRPFRGRIHDTVRRRRKLVIRQALQHVTDVARHASGRRVDFEPLSILSQELQTTLVGAEQERDEIDILCLLYTSPSPRD